MKYNYKYFDVCLIIYNIFLVNEKKHFEKNKYISIWRFFFFKKMFYNTDTPVKLIKKGVIDIGDEQFSISRKGSRRC